MIYGECSKQIMYLHGIFLKTFHHSSSRKHDNIDAIMIVHGRTVLQRSARFLINLPMLHKYKQDIFPVSPFLSAKEPSDCLLAGLTRCADVFRKQAAWCLYILEVLLRNEGQARKWRKWKKYPR
jgi:hypothetical protein